MEKVIVSKSKLEAVANNIRNATGGTDKLTLEQMARIELGGGGIDGVTKDQDNLFINRNFSQDGGSVIINASNDIDINADCTINLDCNSATIDYIRGQISAENLDPANIKKDVDILGLTGTYEGGGSSLKLYLDLKKKADNLFDGFITMTNDQLAEFIPTYDTTSSVTTMNSIFRSCGLLTTIPLLDTHLVTDMNSMFTNCSTLQTIPLLDTSNVTSMSNMFYGCNSLTEIPLLDTSSVTTMSYMFYGCYNLTSVPQLDTSKVTNMHEIFYNCSTLQTIPLLDTSKVTSMQSMFRNCSKLTTISQLDTHLVTDMNYMFRNCSKLTTIPPLDTSSVTAMRYMFYECVVLKTIPPLNTSSVTAMSSMFNYCSALTTIDMYGMKVAFDISPSTLFEASELVKIGSNCQVITSSQTLKMGSTNLAKVTNIYVKYTNQELYEGITCTPCVICESTDEGAMLFTDYMTQKGWTLA